MATHPECRRALSPVPPRVERLHRYVEVGGEFMDIDEAIFLFHRNIVRGYPVNPVLFRCHFVAIRAGRREYLADDLPRVTSEKQPRSARNSGP